MYPFSVHVVTFNFITNLCTYLIKNYHNSHLKQYITRHHTDRYIVCTDAQTTYSHIPEYDEACTPISSNCTSTVIVP